MTGSCDTAFMCDALIVAGDDLRITVYSAEPGAQDAERLALAVVLGTQTLIGWSVLPRLAGVCSASL
jgi:hypothetical protein